MREAEAREVELAQKTRLLGIAQQTLQIRADIGVGGRRGSSLAAASPLSIRLGTMDDDSTHTARSSARLPVTAGAGGPLGARGSARHRPIVLSSSPSPPPPPGRAEAAEGDSVSSPTATPSPPTAATAAAWSTPPGTPPAAAAAAARKRAPPRAKRASTGRPACLS
jgi:hypothetical protein